MHTSPFVRKLPAMPIDDQIAVFNYLLAGRIAIEFWHIGSGHTIYCR